jgi:hypothetical protein
MNANERKWRRMPGRMFLDLMLLDLVFLDRDLIGTRDGRQKPAA